MKRLFSILMFLILMIPWRAFATVDYLLVNHITQELYWAETDHEPGFIGWENIPENKWSEAEAEYLEAGYSMTKNPYKIELGLLIAFLILGGIVLLKVKKK